MIGRIYAERYVPADVKWFWSITEYVHPALGIRTHGRVGSLPVAMEQFKLSWSKVRETSKEQRPARLREWHVVLIRSRGQFLGWVKAASRETAEKAAAETFNLNDWQRRRLLLRECRN